MVKVSIIVPVYNVEKYIRQCLESLINQTLQDIEIIIVNDGTKDKSIEVINDIIETNKKIVLLNKQNGGISSARNYGLRHATGEYISFVDSDDYVDNDYIEKLYEKAKEFDLDIVVGSHTRLEYDCRLVKKVRNKKLYSNKASTGEEFLCKQLGLLDYGIEIWDDLYRRQLLLDENLYFHEGIIHEDDEFTLKVLLKAKRVRLFEQYGYIYRQRQNSLINSELSYINFFSLNEILKELINEYYKSTSLTCKKILKNMLIEYLNILLIRDDSVKVKPNKFNLDLIPRNEIIKIIIDEDKSFKSLLKVLFLTLNINLYKKIMLTRRK